MRPPLTVRKLASRMRARALTNAIGSVLLFVGVLAVSRAYIGQVIHGPEPMTLTELSNAKPAALYGRWFDFTAEEQPRRLLQTTTKRRYSTDITNHFALIRQRAFLVETSDDSLPPRFLAWASELNDANTYYQRARKQLDVWTAGRPSIPLSPVLLQTGQNVQLLRLYLGLALTLATAGIVYLLWRAIRLMRDFTTAAPIARLRKSVRAGEGIPALVEAIDRHLARIEPDRSTGLYMFPGWLISIESNSFDLMSAEDIVWIAPYTQTKKLYAVIPVWRQQLVKVFDRHGGEFTRQVPNEDVADMMKRLHHLAPWAIIGGDARAVMGAKWAELIQAVDKRRKEIHAIWAEQARQPAGQAK
jgi:hypothetical protein